MDISLHHYRKCRKDYWFEMKTYNLSEEEFQKVYEVNPPDRKCFGFRKYDSPDIELLVEAIQDNVQHIQSLLGVSDVTV